MIRFCRVLICVLTLFIAGFGQTVHAKPTITDARAGLHQDATRFVLDLSDNVAFRIYTLENPYRVVIDLRAPAKINQAFILPPGKSDNYRLVIDLGQVADDSFRPSALNSVEAAPKQPRTQPAAAETLTMAATSKIILLPTPPRPGLKPKSTKPLLIVVDPGHGGADPGAIAKNGTYEKNVTLAAARALEVMLIELGYNVVLSRRGDKYLTLSARTEVAQNNNADLFISLHADKHKNRSVRGASVYTLSEKASDAETEALAARENEVDSLFDVSNSDEYEEDVRRILISLVQRTTMTCSAKFAGELIPELKKSTKLLGRTHRFAGFRVLKAPNVPSVLVEMGYMSNDKDRKMLLSEAGRYALMRRVAQAIEDYFSRHESCSQAS